MMMNWFRMILSPETYTKSADSGLFLLRLGAGLMMMTHGWPKLTSFNEKSETFYNFMGLGSEFSLALTVFAEVICSVLLVVGFCTRLVLVPLIILSLVIAFDVQGTEPFQEKEKALLYLSAYCMIILAGPGRYSLDQVLFPKPIGIPI